MTDIMIIIGFIMIGMLGYWIMGKIDQFISSDSWKPQKDNRSKKREGDNLSIKKTIGKPSLSFHTFYRSLKLAAYKAIKRIPFGI